MRSVRGHGGPRQPAGAIARFTYLRARGVVLAAVVLLVGTAALASGVFTAVSPFDIADPDSEVERAYERFNELTGSQPEPEVVLLVPTPEGSDDPEGIARADEAASRLAGIPGVARVRGPEQDPRLAASDDQEVLVLGYLASSVSERAKVGERVVEEFEDDAQGVTAGGTAVAAFQVSEESEHDARSIELYASPVLLILLLLVFRSLTAATLPLIVGAFSILITLAVLRVITEVTDIDQFALQVVTGLGAGLAIDYSLFVLTRYRAEIQAGKYQEAHDKTVSTACRTVAVSSITVAAALAALIVFPQPFLRSTGVAGALVALASGAASALVLPSVLALLGPSVNSLAHSRGAKALSEPDRDRTLWEARARRAMNRPVLTATLGLAGMLLIALPLIGGRISSPDARALPEGDSARQVYEALTNRFPQVPGTNLAAIVPAENESSTRAAIDQLVEAPLITGVDDPRSLSSDSSVVRVEADADPLSDSGQDVLAAVRAAPWPAGTLVAGRAAELADQRSSIEEHAPYAIAIVVVTTLLSVFWLLRSRVLPFVAVAINLLTVAASYGITVAAFKSSAVADLLGFEVQTGIDVSVPILTFAVVFGLSTDYGIFLFSAIAEARRDGASDTDAIAIGLGRTGRMITAAALMFSVAIGAFVFSDLVIIKEFAVGIAVAVILDATIVRGLIVPSVMRLLGARAWAGSGVAGG